MKLKWIILSCLVLLAFAGTGYAQQTNKIGLQYSVGIPMGSLSDYADGTSYRGFKFSYKYILTPSVGLGFDAGINTFYQREYGTFRDGTSALTGTQYRYANNFPILATIAYYLLPDQAFTPYVDFGIGTMYTRHDTDIGLYRSSADAWLFNLKPEIGIIYQLSQNFGIKASGNYYHAFGNDDFDTQSYGTLNLGVIINGSR